MSGQVREANGPDGKATPSASRPVAVWAGFLAMCLGMFMAILDIQIVASSLPEIQAAFGIPLNRLSWVQTAYLVAEVVAIPLTARLTRLLSLRGLFALWRASRWPASAALSAPISRP
jgi:DHA2 family multidrug resistance protein